MDGLKEHWKRSFEEVTALAPRSFYEADVLACVACPSCGYSMWRNDDKTLQCVMGSCELNGRLFKAPTIQLQAIDS